jgi:hypothetical protein
MQRSEQPEFILAQLGRTGDVSANSHAYLKHDGELEHTGLTTLNRLWTILPLSQVSSSWQEHRELKARQLVPWISRCRGHLT